MQILHQICAELRDLKALTSLYVESLGPSGLASLSTLPKLHTLQVDVYESSAGDDDFSVLRELTDLRISHAVVAPSSRIRLSSGLTSLSVKPETVPYLDIVSAKKLSSVQIDLYDRLNEETQKFDKPADFTWLASIPLLSTVTLLDPVAADLKAIPKIDSLRSLSLKGRCPQRAMDDDLIAAVAAMPQLTSLAIENFNDVSSSGLNALSRLTKLEELQLQGTIANGGAKSFEWISDLTELRNLRLSVGTSTNALDLGNLTSRVTGLNRLEQLSLMGNLPNSGLREISSLKQLRVLDLSHCRGYSDDALLELVTALPKLQVLKLGFHGSAPTKARQSSETPAAGN